MSWHRVSRALVVASSSWAVGCAGSAPSKSAPSPPAVAAHRAQPDGGLTSRSALAPELVGSLIQHCSGCHNGSHWLDLRDPTRIEDPSVWDRMFRAVDDQRMPPPRRDAPFPLDPATRSRMSEGLRLLVNDIAERDEDEGPVFALSSAVWMRKVRHISKPYLSEGELK